MATALRSDRLRELLDALLDDSLGASGAGGQGGLASGTPTARARRAFLSRFHFDRLVAAATGEAPGALRRRILLERAAHQLSAARVPVFVAAADAGYGSSQAFSRAFQSAFGYPPSQCAGRATSLHLPSPNGIHFHPPGGLRLPGSRRSTSMDIVTGMTDHDSWLIGEMLARARSLDDETLDRTIEMNIEGLDDAPSIRSLLSHLVWQKEMWAAAVEGRPEPPSPHGSSIDQLIRRHEAGSPRFCQIIRRAMQEGRADETFIDATCDPPHTFTMGGMIAHVLNFAAHRRMLVLGALKSAGINDLGAGDPSGFLADHH